MPGQPVSENLKSSPAPTPGYAGSFRDPSGFVFRQQGELYRAIHPDYQPVYDQLMNSGLYQELLTHELLIPHQEIPAAALQAILPAAENWRVVKPELVSFISYPYEWAFSQLKDAALTTLRIQQQALAYGMILKDASAYNIQFHRGKPVLIDTLSFQPYREGEPWVAYRQFCQHFLAPLALMAHTDVRLNQLLRLYIDGIPLDLASRLLPARTKFSFSLGTHLHFHARTQQRYAARTEQLPMKRVSRLALMGIIRSLESGVAALNWKPAGTEWADYYDATNYSPKAFAVKQEKVRQYLGQLVPKLVWDLGANTGLFSRLASQQGIMTVAADVDPAAVEQAYLDARRQNDRYLLPLLVDLTNPSPALGWGNQERMSFLDRGPADAVLALALVHHLAIGNNLPLKLIARFFARLSRYLVVEFVPKTDSQVQRLLATREDIFPEYTQAAFEDSFQRFFAILDKSPLGDSQRTLYLMKRIREPNEESETVPPSS